MPLYRYRGQDQAGARRQGLLRAPTEVAARAAVAGAGLVESRVRPYRGLPPWPLLWVPTLLALVLLVTLGQLGRLGLRKQGWYRELARSGQTAPGVIAEAMIGPSGADGAEGWRYSFTAGEAGHRVGTISGRRTLSPVPGEVGLREFGAVVNVGDEVTVTYLPERPGVSVPFAMTATRQWYPLRQIAGTMLMLVLLLAILVVVTRRQVPHAWPERALSRTAASWAEGELHELPETAPATPTATPLPPGPWPGVGLLAACLGAYLGLGAVGWWVATAGAVSLVGGMQLAVGLGLLAVPAVVVSLAVRLRPAAAAAIGVGVMVAHGLLLWLQAPNDPGMALVWSVLHEHPLGVMAGWLLPLLAMIALAHWPWLLARLGCPHPLWHDVGD